MQDSMFVFENVTFHYPGGAGLSSIDLAIDRGDYVLVTGPSGSGKSTLLRLAVRLEEPASGRILFKGAPLETYLPTELRRKAGLIQQMPTVVSGTVRENLLLPYSFGVNAALVPPDDATLAAWLKRFQLEGVALDDSAPGLSVGQRQRVCCIRTLLLKPEVLLMDEPTSALDAESRQVVEALTEELNADGVTVVMVSHTGYVPQSIPVRHVEVRGGRLVEVASGEHDKGQGVRS